MAHNNFSSVHSDQMVLLPHWHSAQSAAAAAELFFFFFKSKLSLEKIKLLLFFDAFDDDGDASSKLSTNMETTACSQSECSAAFYPCLRRHSTDLETGRAGKEKQLLIQTRQKQKDSPSLHCWSLGQSFFSNKQPGNRNRC